MLIAFLIMLREGIEAALVVGIVASYLSQTGRARMLPLVWSGVVLASALCLALGVGLILATEEFPQRQQELFEGIVAVIAAGILTSMAAWMRRAARSRKSQLHDSIDTVRHGATRRLAVGCVCWRHVSDDERMLLETLGLAQERRPFEALLLRGILTPEGARAALHSAEKLGVSLARAGRFLPASEAEVRRFAFASNAGAGPRSPSSTLHR